MQTGEYDKDLRPATGSSSVESWPVRVTHSGGVVLSDRLGETELKRRHYKSPTAKPDKYQVVQRGSRPGRLSWEDAPQEDLMAVIAAVTADGAALLLSRTSDGGALVIRVITDTGSTPFYPNSASSLAETLTTLLEVASKA